MRANNKKSKIYTCPFCKTISESIGIIQRELHYYSLNLSTAQLEDFHGDESVESQEYFCLKCIKKIDCQIQ
jgi:hypothetical protein